MRSPRTTVDVPPSATALPTLTTLHVSSETNFYERLQHVWQNVVALEDMGIIRSEPDKFIYAYRFMEAELQKVCLENACLQGRINDPAA
ncbi:hypothetical protein [Fibrisoma montanum]|nr:hypothetical protein [Fibrisoma montanum]